MALTRAEKEAVVAEVAEMASDALSAVASEYRGLTVDQMTSLRQQARDQGVYLRVVKNTLARIAVGGTEFECLQESLKGPMLLAFSKESPGSAARLIRDFAKENKDLKPVMAAIGGRAVDASQLDTIANLPTRDEALSILMATMKAPIGKLATTLNEVPGKLVRTVEAVRLQKDAA